MLHIIPFSFRQINFNITMKTSLSSGVTSLIFHFYSLLIYRSVSFFPQRAKIYEPLLLGQPGDKHQNNLNFLHPHSSILPAFHYFFCLFYPLPLLFIVYHLSFIIYNSSFFFPPQSSVLFFLFSISRLLVTNHFLLYFQSLSLCNFTTLLLYHLLNLIFHFYFTAIPFNFRKKGRNSFLSCYLHSLSLFTFSLFSLQITRNCLLIAFYSFFIISNHYF